MPVQRERMGEEIAILLCDFVMSWISKKNYGPAAEGDPRLWKLFATRLSFSQQTRLSEMQLGVSEKHGKL